MWSISERTTDDPLLGSSGFTWLGFILMFSLAGIGFLSRLGFLTGIKFLLGLNIWHNGKGSWKAKGGQYGKVGLDHLIGSSGLTVFFLLVQFGFQWLLFLVELCWAYLFARARFVLGLAYWPCLATGLICFLFGLICSCLWAASFCPWDLFPWFR